VRLVFLLAVGFYITPALLGGEGQVTFATLIELVVRDLLDWNFGASLGVFLLTVVGALFVLFSTLLGLDRLTGHGGRDRGARHARSPAPLDLLRPHAHLPLRTHRHRRRGLLQRDGVHPVPAAGLVAPVVPELLRRPPVGGADAPLPADRGRHHGAGDRARHGRGDRAHARPVPGPAGPRVLLRLAMVVPSIVLAIGLYLLFARFKLVGQPLALYLAHTVVAAPLVIVIVSAALRTTDPAIELAARSLGAGYFRTLWHVTLPAILPAVVSGAAFAFLVSFDEVVLAIFLGGPAITTLPSGCGRASASRSIRR